MAVANFPPKASRRQNWSFLASHISSKFTDAKIKHTKKRTLPTVEEAWLCSGAALHLAEGDQGKNKNLTIKVLGAKCGAQCQKAWSQSQVMGPPTG